MFSKKATGWMAVAAGPWFLAVYLVLASRNPGYSHLHKAVSELGAWGAPHMWLWNVFGYMLPGAAVALLGAGLVRTLGTGGWLVSTALVCSGLLMVLSGMFPGNFDNRTAPSMVAHLAASLGSYAAFLIAGMMLPFALRSVPAWPRVAWPSLVLVVLSLMTGALRHGDMPGLGQRLTFACFFLWIALVGGALIKAQARTPHDRSFQAVVRK